MLDEYSHLQVLASLAVRCDRCDLAEWPKTTMWKGGREEAKMLERCLTQSSPSGDFFPQQTAPSYINIALLVEKWFDATESKHVETMIRFDRQSFNVVPPKWFVFIWLLVDWVCFCWGGPKTINLTFSPMKSWGTPTPIPLKHPETRVRPPLFGYPYNAYSMLSTYVQYPK